jgi:exonuclease SbcC
MYVQSIQLLDAPGIALPLSLSDLTPQLIILVGPNGSGKSTIGRIIKWQLWPEGVHTAVHASIDWKLKPGDAVAKATVYAGSVHWPDGAPHIPDQAANAWSMNVRALLNERDGALAKVIETALSGGFDLPAVESKFDGSGRVPRNLLKAKNEAQKALQRALDDSEALERKAERLAALIVDVKRAVAAHDEKVLAEYALTLAKKRTARRQQQSVLEQLPGALDRLRVGLDVEIDESTTEVAESKDLIQTRENDLQALDGLVSQLAFPMNEPSIEDVETYITHADTLHELERKLASHTVALTGARSAVTTAKGAILLDTERVEAPGQDAIEALEKALSNVSELTASHAAVVRILQELADPLQTSDPDALSDGARHMRSWLRAPQALVISRAQARANPWGPTVVAIVAALLVIVALGLIITLATEFPAIVAAIAVVLVLCLVAIAVLTVLGLRKPVAATIPAGTDLRAQLQAAWPASAGAEPSNWETDVVTQHLDALEQSIQQGRAAVQLEAQRATAEKRVRSITVERDEAEANLETTVQALGLTTGFAHATLASQAHRLEALAAANQTLALSLSERDEVERQLEAQRQIIQSWLVRVLPSASDSSSAGVKSSLNAISKRLTNLEAARKDARNKRLSIVECTSRNDRQREKLTALWSGAGIPEGERNTLRERLASLGDWEKTQTALTLFAREILALEIKFEQRPDLVNLTEAEAEALIEEQNVLAGTHIDKQAQLSDLQKEIEGALNGDTIQTLTAQQEIAQGQLSDQRDKDAQKAVGRALLQWLNGKVSRDSTPGVLKGARKRFLQFTQDRYSLEVSDGGFVALDHQDGRRRSLDQLSDGTRIQLLLATRLAFLEEAEGQGPKLPLFLDEVLSTTDPERFDQIGRCVLQLVEEGRQVFYATADKAEVVQWHRLCAAVEAPLPKVFHMDEAAVRIPWPDTVALSATVRVRAPDPTGSTTRDYAAQLGVSLPGPRTSFGNWPLILLMHDDLNAAAACWNDGLERVGPFRARHHHGVPLPINFEQTARVLARADLLDAVLELRKIGRGEVVTWADVKASGAITPTRRAEMAACLEVHHDDAVAYLAAVRNIGNMTKKKAQQLEDYFLHQHIIDPQAVLDLDDLAEQALIRVTEHLQAGTMDAGDVRSFVDWVNDVLTVKDALASS